jgi:hypothetical protein
MVNNKFRIIDSDYKKRITEVTGKVIGIYREETLDIDAATHQLQDNARKLGMKEKEVSNIEYTPPCLNIDEIGVGGGAVDILIEEGLPVNAIDVGKPPEGDDPETQKCFLNQRAQYYWKLRELFMNGEPDIDDEELALELSSMKVVWLRNGKIKISDKDDMRKAPPEGIGRSPNKADSMMLAVAKEPNDVAREIIRWL